MQINALGSSANLGPQKAGPIALLKQALVDLGTAIESGNLDDARKALTQLQKNAPPATSKRSNPMSEKIDALTKAIESGNLEAARSAFADLKQALTRGHKDRGVPPGDGGGAPPRAPERPSTSDSGSGTTSIFASADANQDGIVSAAEQLDYDLKHPGEATTDSRLDTTA
jgi:hypothetical protein